MGEGLAGPGGMPHDTQRISIAEGPVPNIAKIVACLFAVSALIAPRLAAAWGATGHRLIGRLAIEALPSTLPAFLQSPTAAFAIGELAREPDRWKGAGQPHDGDLDPGHFLDLGDDGRIFGGPSLADLPPNRQAYETALREVGVSQWQVGYLPYSIIEGWQQLAKDFAYWRVESFAARSVADPRHRAWIAADAARRESLIMRDMGVLAHYVGDGSQPLHVTEHFNGWGPFPNPQGFTQDKVHAAFEGAFVRANVHAADVRAVMAPYHDCACSIRSRTITYLEQTNSKVETFYRLQKAGAFADGDARGQAFAARRLAAGADELRDLIVDAWKASAAGEVGYPALKVRDVLGGGVDPYDSLYGLD